MGDNEINSGEIETGTAGRACEACHKKKTKCDMQQPVCGLCRRTGKECHFPSTRKRPSRQEPSVRAKLQKVNGNLDRLVELLEANPSIEHESLKNILNSKSTSSPSKTPSHSPPKSSASRSNSHTASQPFGEPPQSSCVIGSAQAALTPVSYDLANHLIDVYFEFVQPWLPLFHKPTFLQWKNQALVPGEDCLSALDPAESTFFNSLFSLSARFSDHDSLIDTPARDRGERFMRSAEYWFKIVRDVEEYGLTFLKACIMLAYYHYASGHTRRGWYITHMCIRGCYELSLHQIDDGDDEDEPEDDEAVVDKGGVMQRKYWIEKESLRRTFWCIYEVDSFGSIVKRKPFAIDWRHIQVRMPISDEAWFAGTKVESPKFLPGMDCWRTLINSPNQDARAWSLLSKATVGYVFDLTLYNGGVTLDQVQNAENNICCFKLAMPNELQLTSPTWTGAGMPPARKNWVIATNLYLAAASFILTRLPVIGQIPSPQEEVQSKEAVAYSSRVLELNEVLKRWPSDSLLYAHPCLACTILTYDESVVNLLPDSNAISAYRDLSGLILSKLAERWKLGAVLLRVRDLAHNYYNSNEETKAELVRQYPIYFDRELRKDKKPLVLEAQKMWTPSGGTSNSSHINPGYTRLSTDQSMSPDQYNQPKIQPQPPRQQQPTPPTPQLPPPQALDYSPTDLVDPMFDSSHTNNANNFQNFQPYPNMDPSSDDIDALLSGFMQEPWWQDFGAVNFVV